VRGRAAALLAAVLVGCARGPDLRGLPRLELAGPRLLESIRPGVAFSASLATACPLAGGRLLAVMIDHDPHARPQSGLAAACLVYEVPVEAGFPRLMAVFAEHTPEQVGPVRSVRPAFLQLAAELGAVVAHAGASEPAYRYIRSHHAPTVNEFSNPQAFWRDRRRRMPHNLYASVPRLRELLVRKGLGSPASRPLVERLAYALPEGQPASEVEIPYPVGFGVRFVYRAEAYERVVAGHLHRDQATGLPLRAGSVVVQFARWRGWRAGRVDVSEVALVGSGRGLAFAGGRVVEVTWRKATDASPTVFVDASGQGLLLPGPVWVSVVPDDLAVTVR
jgi:hypothetical protein